MTMNENLLYQPKMKEMGKDMINPSPQGITEKLLEKYKPVAGITEIESEYKITKSKELN